MLAEDIMNTMEMGMHPGSRDEKHCGQQTITVIWSHYVVEWWKPGKTNCLRKGTKTNINGRVLQRCDPKRGSIKFVPSFEWHWELLYGRLIQMAQTDHNPQSQVKKLMIYL